MMGSDLIQGIRKWTDPNGYCLGSAKDTLRFLKNNFTAIDQGWDNKSDGLLDFNEIGAYQQIVNRGKSVSFRTDCTENAPITLRTISENHALFDAIASLDRKEGLSQEDLGIVLSNPAFTTILDRQENRSPGEMQKTFDALMQQINTKKQDT